MCTCHAQIRVQWQRVMLRVLSTISLKIKVTRDHPSAVFRESPIFAVSVPENFLTGNGTPFCPVFTPHPVTVPISGFWRNNQMWDDQADVILSKLFPHNCAVSDSLETHQIARRMSKKSRGRYSRTYPYGGPTALRVSGHPASAVRAAGCPAFLASRNMVTLLQLCISTV